METSRSDRRRPAAVDITPAASDDEAAAIAAAIRQALADATGDAPDASPTVDPWLRAGRFEAVRGFAGRPAPDMPTDPWVAMGRTRR